MKRIQSACLLQTIRFELQDELDSYKRALDKKRAKYAIEEEQAQSDGSVILKIRRQYNQYDTGAYL